MQCSVRTFLTAVCCAGAMFFSSCSSDTASQPSGGNRGRGGIQFPVEVAPIAARSVEYSINAVGSIEAFEVVQVTARVSGVVEQVQFTEGDFVGSDQVLIKIEPERYALALQSARSAFEKAEVAKGDLDTNLARREAMAKTDQGLISAEELETWRTRVRTAAAELAQTRAALNLAELNLRDALVRAPVAGIIQSRTVQTGQYVQPGTVLATLVRRDPLMLRFQIPEMDANRVKPGMTVSFSIRGDEQTYTAKVTYVGEVADYSSRMVAVTAEITHSQRNILRPGAFAQVIVPVDKASEAPVIPQIAVRPSERGFLAYVVEDNVAKERVLDLGMRTMDGLVEVRSGVSPGEILVVRGAEALRDGSQVRITNAKEGSERPAQSEKGSPPSG